MQRLDAACDQTRCASADAVALDRIGSGAFELRMRRQPQVVVGCEHQHLAAVDTDIRLVRALDDTQAPPQRTLLKMLKLGGELGIEKIHTPASPSRGC